jgi:hypothetical protein
MNTTTVLLENLIQGFQTALWLVLLMLTFVDVGTVDISIVSDNAAIIGSVFLAICYWLGIIVDTAYYNRFIQRYEQRWFAGLRRPDEPTLLEMVFSCMLRNADLASLFKERQAHLRMIRVSTVNIVLITVTMSLFTIVRISSHKYLFLVSTIAVGLFLFVIAQYAWRKLYKLYVTMIQTGYRLVRQSGGLSAQTATQ